MFSKHVSSSEDPASNSETTNSPYLLKKFVVCIDNDQNVFVIQHWVTIHISGKSRQFHRILHGCAFAK